MGSTPWPTSSAVTAVKSSALTQWMATRFEPEGDVDDRFLLPVVVLELAIVEVEDVAGGGSRLAKASGAASVAGAGDDPFPRMAARTLGGASIGKVESASVGDVVASNLRDRSG